MFGIASYLAVAVITAVAAFLIAEWTRQPGARAADHPGRAAMAAGLLWPVVLVGVAQCAVVVMAHNKWAGRALPNNRIRVGERAGFP